MGPLLNAIIRIRVPTVAVLGNHDYESGLEQELMRMIDCRGNQGARRERLRARWLALLGRRGLWAFRAPERIPEELQS